MTIILPEVETADHFTPCLLFPVKVVLPTHHKHAALHTCCLAHQSIRIIGKGKMWLTQNVAGSKNVDALWVILYLDPTSQKKKKGPGKIWMIYWISSPHFRQVKKIAECHVRKHVTTGKEALCTRVNLNYACVWLHNNHMTAYSAQPRNRLLSPDPWGLVGSGYVTMLRTVLFL